MILIFLLSLRYSLKSGPTLSCFFRTWHGADFVFTQDNTAGFGKNSFLHISLPRHLYALLKSALCHWGAFPKSSIGRRPVLETCKSVGRLCYSLEKMCRGRKWFWFWAHALIQTAPFPLGSQSFIPKLQSVHCSGKLLMLPPITSSRVLPLFMLQILI